MLGHIRRRRDPFWDDGVAARGRNHRSSVEGALAFGLAVLACGLAAAMWVRPLANLLSHLAFGG